MSQNLKSKLTDIVRDRARDGQGAFQRRLSRIGESPGAMTNNELCRELERAYGKDVLDLLDDGGVAKLYESDLVAALGADRARLVLNHRRRPVEPEALPGARRGNGGRAKKVGVWTSGAIGVGMFIAMRLFTGGTEEGYAATSDPEESYAETSIGDQQVEPEPATVSAYEPYEFSTCAQYLGALSGLQCFAATGGDGLPAETSDSRVARGEMAQSLRASRWSRHQGCNRFITEVNGMSFNAGSVATYELQNSGSLTQESLYNACSVAANRQAYETCASVSGQCDEDG